MTIEVLRRARRVVRDAERGVSAVILAISMMVMMGAAALGTDIAMLAYVKQLVRSSVDSAAQIGASQLGSGTDATTVAGVISTAFNKAYMGNYTGWGNYPKSLTVVPAESSATENVLKLTFLCVVVNPTLPTDPTVSSQASSICSVSSYDASKVKCSSTACAVPCPVTAACNSVSVSANVTVGFIFAPAIHINQAETGAVTTLSCACGNGVSPKPMNVVVMADRTASMWGDFTTTQGTSPNMTPYNGSVKATGSDTNLNALKSGITSMFDNVMNPSQQYVAFGAIHKSAADGSAAPLAAGQKMFTETLPSTRYSYSGSTSKPASSSECTAAGGTWKNSKCSVTSWTSTTCAKAGYFWDSGACYTTRTENSSTTNDVFVGSWVPLGFTKDYQSSSNSLRQNVTTLAYANLVTSGTNGATAKYYTDVMNRPAGTTTTNGTGTHLAAALKGAAQYFDDHVDPTTGLVNGVDDGTRAKLGIKPMNVIILETDGQPSEVLDNATSDGASALSLSSSDDIGAGSSMSQGCKNLVAVAANAKAAGITVITIGFGSSMTTSTRCGASSTSTIASSLAAAASTKTAVTGSGSADKNSCTNANKAAENADDDLFFCAATADDLKTVFKAALGSLGGGTRFLSIPGIGD
jgi:hypothetical protein